LTNPPSKLSKENPIGKRNLLFFPHFRYCQNNTAVSLPLKTSFKGNIGHVNPYDLPGSSAAAAAANNNNNNNNRPNSNGTNSIMNIFIKCKIKIYMKNSK
jgi:hypothetical protein